MAAVIEVRSLRDQLLMLCAGRLGYSRLSKGVQKVLARKAHHEAAAGSELSCVHLRPGARYRKASGRHKRRVVTLYYTPELLMSIWWRWCDGVRENGVMSESRPTLQFDLDLEAVRLLHRSVSFHLEKWPGGPDPREQEALQTMKTLLTAALLEFSLDQDGQR